MPVPAAASRPADAKASRTYSGGTINERHATDGPLTGSALHAARNGQGKKPMHHLRHPNAEPHLAEPHRLRRCAAQTPCQGETDQSAAYHREPVPPSPGDRTRDGMWGCHLLSSEPVGSAVSAGTVRTDDKRAGPGREAAMQRLKSAAASSRRGSPVRLVGLSLARPSPDPLHLHRHAAGDRARHASAAISRLARTLSTRRPSIARTSNRQPANTIRSPTRGTRRSNANSSPASV